MEAECRPGIFPMSSKNLSNYLIKCLEDASQAQLPSSTIPNFSLSDAYRTALEIKEIREGKKEKALGIKELSIKFLKKEFDPKLIKNMNDEEAIQYLSSLRQIGRWSAEMILLFTYNRSNIWPLQDIGLLRAISNNYKKKYFPPKSFLNKLYKKFTPYCSVATWYLWRSIDDEPIQY